jgi:ABC-type ATPase with predicted acetyltransferase domain
MTVTVWWCSLCREMIQAGARPDVCPDCGPQHGKDLRPLEIPFVEVQ